MTNNYYISKTEPVRNGDGTNVYFTFSYPESSAQINGNVQLTDDEYLTALENGTSDDRYAGLYQAIQAKLVTLNTVTATTAADTATTATTTSTTDSSTTTSATTTDDTADTTMTDTATTAQ